MFIDAQNMYSDSQALPSGATVSTHIIDHGSDRDLGVGEGMAVVVTCDVALAGGTPTITVALQTDDNAGFTTPTVVAASGAIATLAAGGKVVVALPADTNVERFTRLNYTLGGTGTATVTAYLAPMSMIQGNSIYADAISIG